MRDTGEQFALRRLSWQAFCTLTFRREKMPERIRYTSLFAWLRKVAACKKVHFSRLLWVVRAEHGESTGRFHFHVLIGGLPENTIDRETCSYLVRIWDRQLSMGIADVREWDGRDAVAYIYKDDFSLKGANAYELGKFRGESKVTLSRSVIDATSRRLKSTAKLQLQDSLS